MSRRSPNPSGALARVASALALLLTAGCIYSFTGGGLPGHVRTIAILPLENETTEPLLETDVQTALQNEFPRQLGVRLAGEEIAHAVVRGVINSYAETPASVRPSQEGQAPVVQQEVRITYDIEIYDRTQDQVLWRVRGQSVTGNFDPSAGETPREGKTRALRDLVRKVIEGAQSQW